MYIVHDEIVCGCTVFTHHVLLSGSHGGKGDVYRAAAVWSGLHLVAEEGGRGGAAAASSGHRCQETNSVTELCGLICALSQRWRPVTGSCIISSVCLSHPHPKTWCDIYFGTF